MKLLCLLVIISLLGCEKINIQQERLFRSVQPHLYCVTNHLLTPPHNYVTDTLIRQMADANYQYDSLYVTCLPHRNEYDSDALYSVKWDNSGSMFILYHFFAPKKQAGGTLWVMYDPQGDSIQKYMGQFYYGD